MGIGDTRREILEKKMEKRLQDPKTEPLISLPLDFLEDITCGFSDELGRGGYGVVYKGVLRSGKAIAVKKIVDTHLLASDNQVENEIICLKDVTHQNVVLLVGYCVETKSVVMEHNGKHVMAEKRACLLCFEFVCNGSLDKHLSVDTMGLDWNTRYKIIRGVCRGLHYLHEKRHIVHRDVKPQNILMDETMTPKIADFGLSRLLGEQKSKTVTTTSAGTIGYKAKEYIDHGIISYKADIFSLGVIIIEIITGRRDYPNIGESTEMSLNHCTDQVVGSWKKRLIDLTPMDIFLGMHIQQVQQCFSIALKCLEPESNKRPTSVDIVQSLNAVELKCISPGNPPNVVEMDRRNHNLHVNELQRARSQGRPFVGGCSAARDISSGAAMFDMEYGRWLDDDSKRLAELQAGLQAQLLDGNLDLIVDEYMHHYDELFQLKGALARSDIFHLLTGAWATLAERCFFWMGGFHPSELLKILIPQLEPLTEQLLLGIYNIQPSLEQAEEALTQGLHQLHQSLADTVAPGTLNHVAAIPNYMSIMALALNKLANVEGFYRQQLHRDREPRPHSNGLAGPAPPPAEPVQRILRPYLVLEGVNFGGKGDVTRIRGFERDMHCNVLSLKY